ncbi:MAG: thermonuclease family protein, partial [Alphaproteobacteria bacterium]|nr:thermonuclease family protein [Alphaproteobacteria bacterium]
ADGVDITVRVRLINIDTPEINGECASESKMARRARGRLEKLLPRGATIELENIKDDKYLGRIDANAILSDGRDVGEVLVRDGLARRYNGGRRQPWCKK